jgi:hypothetical protein
MDDLPDAIQTLATTALGEMRADPRHRLPPRRLQALYAALAAAPGLSATPHWLAVLAAERVLPLFRTLCPEDELPPALLATAIGVLEGHMDRAVAALLEAQGYQTSENAWGYEVDGLPWPVGLAADAVLRALREARGYQPLTNLEACLDQGTLALQTGPAACQARSAPASRDFGHTCDPERLQAFWTWWLQGLARGRGGRASRQPPVRLFGGHATIRLERVRCAAAW